MFSELWVLPEQSLPALAKLLLRLLLLTELLFLLAAGDDFFGLLQERMIVQILIKYIRINPRGFRIVPELLLELIELIPLLLHLLLLNDIQVRKQVGVILETLLPCQTVQRGFILLGPAFDLVVIQALSSMSRDLFIRDKDVLTVILNRDALFRLFLA
ncbi:hypothetical protein D3C74_319500 [compost metagenome]